MIFKLINFFRGYVHLKVYGKFSERFINICVFHNIFLWNIKRLDKDTITLYISKRAYNEMEQIAEKSKVKTEVIKKYGLPFIIAKYKKRKPFAIGALIFVVTSLYLLSVVWNVEVTGNETIELQDILNDVKKSGIYPGVPKRKIDRDDVISRIMLEREDLSWVGIYIKGTKVTVALTERALRPVQEDNSYPCDIVAGKDGVVSEVIVKAGEAAVKKGDSVFKGDVLIKGKITLKYSNDEMNVHATGEVYATTWYNIKMEIPTEKILKEYTGKEYRKTIIEILGKSINLPKIRPMNFEMYDLDTQVMQAVVTGNIFFPINKTVYVYKEYQTKKISMSEKESILYCTELIEDKAKDIISDGAEILEKYFRYVYDEDGKKYAEMIFECKEDIGIKEKVGGFSE